MWEAILLTVTLAILGLNLVAFFEYIRLRRGAVYCISMIQWLSNMDCDEIINQLLEQQEEPVEQTTWTATAAGTATGGCSFAGTATLTKKRERLTALAAGGQAKQYLGVAATADQVDAMEEDEIEKLYARYEACLVQQW